MPPNEDTDKQKKSLSAMTRVSATDNVASEMWKLPIRLYTFPLNIRDHDMRVTGVLLPVVSKRLRWLEHVSAQEVSSKIS